MIHHLKGKIELKSGKFLVIEVAGVGFKVFCSPTTLNKISEGEEVKIFTSLYLKEDSVELYGFLAIEELGLFDVLNSISGIGPKTAMMLASLGSLEKLKEIMEKGKLPPEIKGIGQKRMQKILLELTGKIRESKTQEEEISEDSALDALVSLGFQKQRAKAVLSRVPAEIKDPQKRIKEALKLLGK